MTRATTSITEGSLDEPGGIGPRRVAAMKVWVLFEGSDFDGCSPPYGVYSSKELAEAVQIGCDDPGMLEIIELELDAKPDLAA